MPLLALVVLLALLLDYALGTLADVLNLRALRPAPPAELAACYEPETYRRSQEYTRAKTRFGLVTRTFDLAVLLAFWWLGGFEWLDGLVRGLGLGPVPRGVAYVAALLLGGQLLGLPFSLWSTFVLEQRFGFNRTTPGTFALDRLKGLLLGALLGGPLLAAILWFFGAAGADAWLWCWGVATAFVLFVQFVGPTWIMPLFNRFEPLEQGELRDAILEYGRANAFPLEGVYVIDGSRRSTKANAFFTGFGRNKRIALYDTLVAGHGVRELVSVLAHEIGHYRRGHIVKGLVLQVAHFGLLFGLLSLVLESEALYAAFGVSRPSVYVGLVLFVLLYTPVELVLSLAMQAWARHNEYEADAFAAQTTGDPEPLVRALEKLSADTLSNLTPHPFYVALHHSHPPLLARVRALRAAVS